jgi:hypothetical protein
LIGGRPQLVDDQEAQGLGLGGLADRDDEAVDQERLQARIAPHRRFGAPPRWQALAAGRALGLAGREGSRAAASRRPTACPRHQPRRRTSARPDRRPAARTAAPGTGRPRCPGRRRRPGWPSTGCAPRGGCARPHRPGWPGWRPSRTGQTARGEQEADEDHHRRGQVMQAGRSPPGRRRHRDHEARRGPPASAACGRSRSDCRAQKGEETPTAGPRARRSPATISSGMPIDRPMAGSTEIMPVLPMAVATETPKMIAKGPLGRASLAVAVGMGMVRPVSSSRRNCATEPAHGVERWIKH